MAELVALTFCRWARLAAAPTMRLSLATRSSSSLNSECSRRLHYHGAKPCVELFRRRSGSGSQEIDARATRLARSPFDSERKPNGRSNIRARLLSVSGGGNCAHSQQRSGRHFLLRGSNSSAFQSGRPPSDRKPASAAW